MKKIFLFFMAILFSAGLVLAEEIKLTTIVPNQSLVRGKDGAIGPVYQTKTDPNVPNGNLVVEGNVGVGTDSPQSPAPGPLGTPTNGNLDANDVYLRSVSRWLSGSPRIKVGSHVGTGTGGTVTINLGFRPDAIIVTRLNPGTVEGNSYLKTKDMPGQYAKSFSQDKYDEAGITIIDTGFTVTWFNSFTHLCVYIALKGE